MKRQIALLGLFAAGGTAPAQAANEPQVLKPSVAWTLDYAPERCSLIRRFGGERDGAILQIDSYGSLTNFQVLIVGEPVPKAKRVTGEITYRFSADQADRHEVRSLHGMAGEFRSVSFNAVFAPFDPSEPKPGDLSLSEYLELAAEPTAPVPDFEAQISGIVVKFDKERQLELATGTMAKPLAALRTCVANLYTSWGLDPELQGSLSRRPIPTETTVKKIQQRYPAEMVLSGTSAYVPVRLMVDAEGKAGDCVVQTDNVDEEFRKATCQGLSRRFEPARDKAGNPVASVYQTSVVYVIG